MHIPILLEHDYTGKIYGYLTIEDDKLIVQFEKAINKDLFFELFPCGFRTISCEQNSYEIVSIYKAEIIEFSFDRTMKNIDKLIRGG